MSQHNSSTADENEKKLSKLEQDFTILGEPLGKGGFGEIVKARRKCDENEYAIKIIKFLESGSEVEKRKEEAKMLATLDHKNIVRYFNSWIESCKVPFSEWKARFSSYSRESLNIELSKLCASGYNKTRNESEEREDNNDENDNEDSDNSLVVFRNDSSDKTTVNANFLHIQMELCANKTLRTLIDQGLYKEEHKIVKYFTEICEGLSYIHKKDIVHRDLKPENIFLTTNDVIKIGDFGLSKQIAVIDALSASPTGNSSVNYPCGTPIYIAPEIYYSHRWTTKADMYSLGIIYYEMCSKPMTEMEKCKTFPISQSSIDKLTFEANAPRKKSLLKNLLNLNKDRRPTCDIVLENLESRKSMKEIKGVIMKQKKIPKHRMQVFCDSLDDASKNEATTYFISKASNIFELHGADIISIPTFLPHNLTGNLPTLININTKTSCVSNTSRIGFAYYVAHKGIKNMRKYATGKVFDNGYFLPDEKTECVLYCISPDKNDYIADSEMLFIVKQTHNKLIPEGNGDDINFYINHKAIFSSIIELCSTDQQTSLTSCLNKASIGEEVTKSFNSLNLEKNYQTYLEHLSVPRQITSQSKILLTKVNQKKIRAAVDSLNRIVINAGNFGIKPENIFLTPLLSLPSNGFFFEAYLGNTIIASGGRFESLIQKFQKRKHPLTVSAVEVSFKVKNFVDYLIEHGQVPQPTLDVWIISPKPELMIPLYHKLQLLNMKSEIARFGVLENGRPMPYSVIVHNNFDKDDDGIKLYNTIYINKKYFFNCVYVGDWTLCDFEKFCQKKYVESSVQMTHPQLN